jgi:catechol 2,3-dioxygenase-like lactoylglutathione lyase family enzyme
VEWKLELVALPVSNVERAKAFYTERAGFHAAHDDYKMSEDLRFVQLTPPARPAQPFWEPASPSQRLAKPRPSSSSPTLRPPTRAGNGRRRSHAP